MRNLRMVWPETLISWTFSHTWINYWLSVHSLPLHLQGFRPPQPCHNPTPTISGPQHLIGMNHTTVQEEEDSWMDVLKCIAIYLIQSGWCVCRLCKLRQTQGSLWRKQDVAFKKRTYPACLSLFVDWWCYPKLRGDTTTCNMHGFVWTSNVQLIHCALKNMNSNIFTKKILFMLMFYCYVSTWRAVSVTRHIDVWSTLLTNTKHTSNMSYQIYQNLLTSTH